MILRSLVDEDLKKQVQKIFYNQSKLNTEIESLKMLAGNIKIDGVRSKGIVSSFKEVEFKVFSQFGDDGIIQYLINNIDIETKTFIEFGVQDYSESNTRFLLLNDNWKGLIFDGSQNDMENLRNDEIYWRYDLTAVGAFLTKSNINELFKEYNFVGEIGILSVDIDGNDYWIWESINSVNPVIVIAEYNSVFGNSHAITIPYDESFNRTKAHFSNLFWGCSLKALIYLAKKKGYVFAGCNSAGNNAYFIREDKIGNLVPSSLERGYVRSKFRESRDRQGNLTFHGDDQRIRIIEECEVYDLERETLTKIKDLGI